MKLYACGCNLSGQISNPATVDVPWTLIQEWDSQAKGSRDKNKDFIITFGFSYCVYACDNKLFIKGFDNIISEEITIPETCQIPDNDPHIICVSTYRNHIIVIQSNGSIWKLDLLNKMKQNRIEKIEPVNHIAIDKRKLQRPVEVLNKKETIIRNDESTRINPSLVDNQNETNDLPIAMHQTYTISMLEKSKELEDSHYSDIKDANDKPDTKTSQSQNLKCENLEAECTKSSFITQSIDTKNLECTVKDSEDKCLEVSVKDEYLISVTQINHLFTCELDVCDDETNVDLGEETLTANEDTENPVCHRSDDHRSKRQRIATGKRNHLVKAVCSDNIQLLLSEQGQVFHIPGRLDHFLGQVVTDIACGFDHCLALTQDGLVYSWGNGSRGQLGYPSPAADTHSPREIPALSGLGVVQIAAGGWHSVARTGDGFLYAWGWNNSGQLGVKGKLELVMCEPTPMTWSEDMDAPDIRAVDVACGSRHTLVLCDDNSVWGCGWNEYSQLSRGNGVRNVEELSRISLPGDATTECLFGAHWNSALLVS